MGKERVKRRHRFNPMAAGHGASDDNKAVKAAHDDVDKSTAPIVPSRCESAEELIAGLQSAVTEERAAAATILAAAAADATYRHEVIRPAVIHAAVPLLADQTPQIQCCILSWLRNITPGGSEVCEALVNANVLTHLLPLLQRLSQQVVLGKLPSPSAEADTSDTLLLDALNILTSLCESSEISVQAVTDSRTVTAFFPLLTAGVAKFSIAAGHCLLTVTEDNPQLAAMLASEMETLESVLHNPTDTPAYLLLKATVSGIMHNLGAPSTCLPLLIGSAKTALEYDISGKLSAVTEQIGRMLQVKRSRDTDVERAPDVGKELDLLVSQTYEVLQAKKIALELLVNLCCSEEDEEQWDDIDADEFDDDAISTRSGSTAGGHEQQISAELQAALCSGDLLPTVLNHIGPLDATILAKLLEYRPTRQICRDIHDIRYRALLCVDNLAQSLDLVANVGADKVREIYVRLMQIAFSSNPTNGESRDSKLLEAASSACRAILDCLHRATPSARVASVPFAPMTLNETAPASTVSLFSEDELASLCNIVLTNPAAVSPSVRVNITRIVATLATLHRPFVIGAGLCLAKVANQDEDLLVCSEAADAVIDVFADDSTDAAAREIDLVNQLRALAPRFKHMLRLAPKSENKLIASTCYANLMRFIKYKAKRLA